jgi:predicted secreted protein
VQTFDEPTHAIRVALGETFAITLAGNPTTGYLWEANVDDRYLELISQEFEHEDQSVGAGGREVFRFRALAPGETEINCEHRRPWSQESRDEKQFQVVIS